MIDEKNLQLYLRVAIVNNDQEQLEILYKQFVESKRMSQIEWDLNMSLATIASR